MAKSSRLSVTYLVAPLLFASCSKASRSDATPTFDAPHAAAPTRESLPPSQWEVPGQWVVLRDEKGKAVALVSVGSSSTDPRPIVVSVHGSQSNPEWNCPHVRRAFGSAPWIVCPHPTAHLGADASWQSANQIAEAIERSVTLLTSKVGARADREDVHFIGHSQGAVQGPPAVSILRNVHMRTVTLFEGPPYDARSVSALLQKATPERVFLLSGSNWGVPKTRELGQLLHSAGVPVHLKETGSGHFFEQQTYAAVQGELPWLMPTSSLLGPPSPPARLAALEGFFSEELFREGKRIAIADVPAGTAEARPIIFAAHAAGVGPEWICAAARQVFGPKPIVLCPDDAPSTHVVANVMGAASLRFGPYLAREDATYFGYSQGAMLSPSVWAAAATPAGQPLQFTSAILLEGLPPQVTGLPATMQRAGLRRVFLVSGQGGWAAGHAALAAALRSEGIDAKHLALTFGHVPTAEVVTRIASERAWLRPE